MTKPGEGPAKPAEAKARVKGWWEKPEHKDPKHDPDTKNDRLNDPAKNKEDE